MPASGVESKAGSTHCRADCGRIERPPGKAYVRLGTAPATQWQPMGEWRRPGTEEK